MEKVDNIKKVLILGQRKTGIYNYLTKENVEDIIIPKITEIVEELVGIDYKIIYISDITGYDKSSTVDINCNLDNVNECSKVFISANKNSFDLIILQTCPFIFLNYNILYNLLKYYGKIGLTSFPKQFKILFNDKARELQNNCIRRAIQTNLFQQIDYDNDNIIIYNKNNDLKKVLVIYKYETIKNIIIPNITKIVEEFFGINYTITYMLDFNCNLDKFTECSKLFISENDNTFDLIILQNCIFRSTDYTILYKLLNNSGKIGLTAFPLAIYQKTQELSEQQFNIIFDEISNELFQIAEHDNGNNINIIVYNKIVR